ncbi:MULTISPECIES: flagellar protein FlgN [Gracilibacillus]|uniref:flagellar protein FlgN n=1 Tax=Gracilibacillus TaxID=74385 RepID=UPI0008248190|nr:MULTISPECIES: flagellar protein FlgN [Gracilibacillus]
MPVQTIIKQLNKLIELHDSLIGISKQKTEIVKAGDTQSLQNLLIREQKHVQAINQIEERRIASVQAWAAAENMDPKTVTVADIIEEHAQGVEKIQLEEVTVALASQLMELRRQEDLNKQLIQQSLQFIQLSLDMMQPSITNMNYGNTTQSGPKRSVFDSKA